jgi:hypothetical protein
MDLKKIISKSRINGTQRFEEDKKFTNTDEGNEMITFCSKTIRTKKVNDWGRDEDDDQYIGLDRNGWIKYTHTIEYLAGPLKIKEASVLALNDDSIFNYLTSEECSNEEYLDFIAKARKYYNE